MIPNCPKHINKKLNGPNRTNDFWHINENVESGHKDYYHVISRKQLEELLNK